MSRIAPWELLPPANLSPSRVRGTAADEQGGPGPTACGRALTRARVSKKIAPDQPGAGRWQRQFGERLLCVRYRDDPDQGRRVVTVELLVDERPLPPPPKTKLLPTDPVAVVIQYREMELRQRVRAAGGVWDPDERVWRLTRQQAEKAGLGERIRDGERAR